MRVTPPLPEDERLELLNTMDNEELRQGVIEGKYYILGPSDTPGKPIVRWSDGPKKGKPVKGSGAARGAGLQAGRNSKVGAYKRTQAFNTLMLNYWGDEDRLEWLFKQAEEMVKGGPVVKAEWVTCPCGCDHSFKHEVEMYKKGDANALKIVWEAVMGRATERKEVDVNIRALMARLDENVSLSDFEIVDLTPEQVTERLALSEAGDASREYLDLNAE